MAYSYIGENRALVFPIMCDGYVKIPYDNFHPTSINLEDRYSLWGHTDSFTIESIITPYEINGFGTSGGVSPYIGNNTSQKSMPALSEVYQDNTLGSYVSEYIQSENYLSQHQTTLQSASRFSQKMYIFKNGSCELYLENTTTSNYNEPAEYKIVFKIKASNGVSYTTTTLESSKVFVGSHKKYGVYDEHGYYESDSGLAYTKVLTGGSPATISSVASTKLVLNGPLHSIGIGTEIFNSKGESYGRITGWADGSSHATRREPQFSVNPTTTASGETNIFMKVDQECLYVENSFHVAASFNIQGRMSIFANGVRVATGTHGVTSNLEFSFDPEDCYLGQDAGLGTESLRRATQFMGEFHEFAISKGASTNFTSIDTLSPNLDDLLLYYRFGGE